MTNNSELSIFDHIIFQRIKHEIYTGGQAPTAEQTPRYMMEDFDTWAQERFAHSEVFLQVHTICLTIMSKYIKDIPRQSGPAESDFFYQAHAMRTARILIEELGFNNPFMYAHALLHDVPEILKKHSYSLDGEFVEKIYLKSLTEFANDLSHLAFEIFNTHDNILADLVPALVAFEQHDLRYDSIATSIMHDGEITEQINAGLEEGFTPKTYSELKRTILNQYMHNPQLQPFDRYLNLHELMQLMQYNISGNDTSSHSPDGLAIMITMIAQAIDNFRYPELSKSEDVTDPVNGSIETRKVFIKQAIDIICNLLPIARAINHPAAIRLLSEIPARAFLPEQYAACTQAIKNMSYQCLDESGKPTYFDVQVERNMKIIHRIIKQITEELSKESIQAVYVSPEEFEQRKILMLSSQWQGPLLQPFEFSLIGPSKKTIASLFDKVVFKYATKNKFAQLQNAHNAVGDEGLMELMKDPDFWQEILHRYPDILRATIVLGNGLSRVYTQGTDSTPSIYDRFKFHFSNDDEKGQASTIPNHFHPLDHDQFDNRKSKITARGEAIESRIKGSTHCNYGVDSKSNYFFEDHFILHMRENFYFGESMHPSLPFELHVESVNQYIRDELGEQMHILHKFPDIMPRSDESEDVLKNELIGLYQKIILLVYFTMYKDAIIDPTTFYEALKTPPSVYHSVRSILH